MRIALLINTTKGEVEVLRDEVARLRRAGHEVDPRLTFEAGDARRMAREAAGSACDVVVVAGGDGTLNEAVNGLHDFLDGAGPGARSPRLAIVPLGTANDFATELGIPPEIPRALEIALSGRVVEVDVGLVNGRCFINVSTGGFGAEATEETPDEAKNALGPLAYVVTGVRKFATLEVSRARFADGEVIHDGGFLLFAVGNGRRTGGGNRLTPRAELADGKLDLCVVTEMSRIEFARLLPGLRAGTHLDHRAVVYRQVSRVVVDAAEELSVNADGEALAGRRLEYRVSPHRIPVAVPAEVDGDRGRGSAGPDGARTGGTGA